MMYEMKAEYFTGIKFVDEEHTKLFEITNRLYEISHDDYIPDKYDYIIEVIKELKDYTQYHFGHEEEFMKSINYKKFFSHIVEHNDFVETLEKIDFDTVDFAQEETIMSLLNYLYDWLVNHICVNDMKIAKALEEREAVQSE